MIQTDQELKQSGLIYVQTNQKGIYRKGKPGNFYYTDQNGERIRDPRQLQRIKALVLPPAWTAVWIARSSNAHLQATGLDIAGRKQYRYHQKWTSRRSEAKYFRLLEFGNCLPQIRKTITADLRRKQFDERKVLAICVQVMLKTLIRIGNESYKQLYGSYGLSTLRDKHVKIKGNTLQLSFTGKKGVKQQIRLNDKSLAKLVKKCRDIPGQELFQYYVNEQEHHAVDSGQINAYIQEISGTDFTAKDFRTWGGTLEALRQLAKCDCNDEKHTVKKILVEVLDGVAAKLGNTRAVCKSSYVYPELLNAYEQGELDKYLKQIDNHIPAAAVLQNDEKVLLKFLKNIRKKNKVTSL
eukprot:gene13970-16472_t